jgi:hypothetical protein
MYPASTTEHTEGKSHPLPSSKARVVALHLLLSLSVMAMAAVIVFEFWFPDPWQQLADGLKLFAILAGVDVVCGPLLTAVLYRTSKSRREVSVDLTLVALIQLAALAYGLNALAQARPLAQVFEVDRFRLVSSADITEEDSKYLPAWFQPWSLAPIRTVGLRPVTSSEERLQSLEAAMQGVDAGQRPQRWQDYERNNNDVRNRASPLVVLNTTDEKQRKILDRAIASALRDKQEHETDKADKLLWLPLVSRRNTEWIVLLDPVSLRVRAYAPLDGFQSRG